MTREKREERREKRDERGEMREERGERNRRQETGDRRLEGFLLCSDDFLKIASLQWGRKSLYVNF